MTSLQLWTSIMILAMGGRSRLSRCSALLNNNNLPIKYISLPAMHGFLQLQNNHPNRIDGLSAGRLIWATYGLHRPSCDQLYSTTNHTPKFFNWTLTKFDKKKQRFYLLIISSCNCCMIILAAVDGLSACRLI